MVIYLRETGTNVREKVIIHVEDAFREDGHS